MSNDRENEHVVLQPVTQQEIDEQRRNAEKRSARRKLFYFLVSILVAFLAGSFSGYMLSKNLLTAVGVGFAFAFCVLASRGLELLLEFLDRWVDHLLGR